MRPPLESAHLEDGLGFLRGGSPPPHQQVVAYIDAHRHDVVDGREVGVEPICAVLKEAGVQIAPSSYYAAKARPPSARAIRDAALSSTSGPHTRRTSVSTARGRCTPSSTAKASGSPAARSRRQTRADGLRGIPREKTRKTTIGDGAETERPEDLVKRSSSRPRRTSFSGWPDLTYVRTHSGLGLRRLRHRRLQPHGRGLAGVDLAAH